MKLLVHRNRTVTSSASGDGLTVDIPDDASPAEMLAAVAGSNCLDCDGAWKIYSRVPVGVISVGAGQGSYLPAPYRPLEMLRKDEVVRLDCYSNGWISRQNPSDLLREMEQAPWVPASALKTIEEGGFADAYYELCRRHPLRNDASRDPMPAREIVKRARGVVDLIKESGPGTVFTAANMPDELRLAFVLRSGCAAEASIQGTLLSNSQGQGIGPFRIFCRDAKEWSWKNEPDHLYQDPWVYSVDEFLSVALQIKTLSIDLAQAVSGRSLPNLRVNWGEMDEAIRKWVPAPH